MSFTFIFHPQLDAMDCGAACLQMVARAHGRFYSLETMRQLTFADRDGVSMLAISDAAEAIGLHSLAVKLTLEKLIAQAPLPCIVYWRQRHFVVVYKVSAKKIWVADPAEGKFVLSHQEFLDGWAVDGTAGFVLLLEPTPAFFEQPGETDNRASLWRILPYLKRYKVYLWQIGLGVVVAGLINLAMPFLTQAVVDVGINNLDIRFIYIVLAAQLALFIGRMAIEIIRGWLLLHIGSRVHISLTSNYLAKLIRLPLRFFASRQTGDLLQRIHDNERVEHFLTSASLFTLFSIFNLLIFGAVLAVYHPVIFGIFVISAALYTGWVMLFLKRRQLLDYRRFDRQAQSQNDLIELINGISDAKTHNAGTMLRWRWERNQAKIFDLSLSYLSLENYQRAGTQVIVQGSQILMTFIAARAVMQGQLSLGAMLAVQYIVGQLQTPLEHMLGFVQLAQDASISLDRMQEVHDKDDEDVGTNMIDDVPPNGDIVLDKVVFHYGDKHSPPVINDVSLKIPYGKTTAIVGLSGSGKTTLIKLLLGFYEPVSGSIRIDTTNLRYIRRRAWRQAVGAVLQDGFIFSDTIAANIALGETRIDLKRLQTAIRVANLQGFIESRPLGLQTKIGDAGAGLSQGQRQRLLIARALYKQPRYLFFDEATNALDAFNELLITDQLREQFGHTTMVIVAHRLSTVRHADQIVVLDQGEIVEQGSHDELINLRGHYYQLIRNQLELGA